MKKNNYIGKLKNKFQDWAKTLISLFMVAWEGWLEVFIYVPSLCFKNVFFIERTGGPIIYLFALLLLPFSPFFGAIFGLGEALLRIDNELSKKPRIDNPNNPIVDSDMTEWGESLKQFEGKSVTGMKDIDRDKINFHNVFVDSYAEIPHKALSEMIINDNSKTRINYLISMIIEVQSNCCENGELMAAMSLDNLIRIAEDVRKKIEEEIV